MRACVCVCVYVCVVSVIVKRPVLPPSVVEGRARNPLYYYYYYSVYVEGDMNMNFDCAVGNH